MRRLKLLTRFDGRLSLTYTWNLGDRGGSRPLASPDTPEEADTLACRALGLLVPDWQTSFTGSRYIDTDLTLEQVREALL